MAATQPTSLHARTKSGRVPANIAKQVVASTIATRPPSSAASTTSTTSTQPPSTASHLPTFLTNLRLLDLDLLPDWPGITQLTFASRDAGQGQKKRIQAVEWALYYLFALWDTDEAANKLQPLFPPRDQVQSLNLRAALLRALDQAKRSGVLGRDAVVRKTMLDECKGERLEEVLAVFSSAVLKKAVAEDQLNSGEFPAVAQIWALEKRGYSGDRAEVNALVLAHRASLSGLLREKEKARAKYTDFSDLLDLKQRTITRRHEQLRSLDTETENTGEDISDDMKRDIRRTVRNNWSGNERWMETLLYSDANARGDGLLTTPFDRVWRRVQSGRLSELEDKSAGLLEQLDTRVRVQKERLQRWKGLRDKMFGDTVKEPDTSNEKVPDKQKGIDLGFGAHETLHLGRMSPRKLPRKHTKPLNQDYADLMEGLNTELQAIRNGTSDDFRRSLQSSSRQRGPPSGEHLEIPASDEDPISELSDLEEELLRSTAPPPPASVKPPSQPGRDQPNVKRSRTFDVTVTQETDLRHRPSRPQRSSTMESAKSAHKSRQVDISPPRPQLQSPPESLHGSPPRTPSPVRPPARRPLEVQAPVPPSPEEVVSATQQMADQILATMNNASPSPVKKSRHTLSLAERTRLSMARGAHAARLDEDNEPDFDVSLAIRRTANASSAASNSGSHPRAEETASDAHDDLVARTRKSMAGFEAARQKAQIERRRSQRKSRHMPSASTSRREGSSYFPAVEEGDNSVLAEELMSGEQNDPEAIFKSRPKIKNSPAASPERAW